MLSLDPLPPHINPLSPQDFDRLASIQPGLWRSPGDKCLTCDKKGTFRSINRKTLDVEEYECNCREQWMLHLHLLNAGVFTHYQRVSWSDIDGVPPEVTNAIKSYADHAAKYVRGGTGVILRGKNGTGKTLLATLLLKSLVQRGYDCFFTTFDELLTSHTTSWRDSAERERFNRLVGATFLVIDEVGKETKGRENVVGSMFDHVIRRRVADDKPTIITTNMTREEMKVGYGNSIMSLLTEACSDIEVTGNDYREKANGWRDLDIEADTVRPLVLS